VTYIGVAINDLGLLLEGKLDERKRFWLITACVFLILAQPAYTIASKVIPRSFINNDTEYSVLASKSYLEENVNGKASVVFAGFYVSHPRVVLGEIGNYGIGSRKLNGNVWGDYFMYGRGNNEFLIEQFQKWHNGCLASGEPRFDNVVYYKSLDVNQIPEILINAKADYFITTVHLDSVANYNCLNGLIEKRFCKEKDKLESYKTDGVEILTNEGSPITIFKVDGSNPEAMICSNPQVAYDYYWNAVIYARIGQQEKTIVSLEKTLNLNPNHKGALTTLGARYANQGKFKESIEYFERVLKVDEKNLNVMANLGRSYFYSKDYKESIEAYNMLLDLKSDYTDGYIMNCQSFLALNDTTSALNELVRAEKEVPNAANIYAQKGNILQQKGDVAGALVAYRKAYGINPADLQSISSAYAISSKTTDLSGALQDLNAFIVAQPNNGPLYLARGNVFERLNNKEKACADYANAQKLGDARAVSFRSRLCF
jgi:tetratricopeptide (TPR) repeat protein